MCARELVHGMRTPPHLSLVPAPRRARPDSEPRSVQTRGGENQCGLSVLAAVQSARISIYVQKRAPASAQAYEAFLRYAAKRFEAARGTNGPGRGARGVRCRRRAAAGAAPCPSLPASVPHALPMSDMDVRGSFEVPPVTDFP